LVYLYSTLIIYMFRPVNLQRKVQMCIGRHRQQRYFDLWLVGKKKMSNKVRCVQQVFMLSLLCYI